MRKFTELARINKDHFDAHPVKHTILIVIFAGLADIVIGRLIERIMKMH